MYNKTIEEVYSLVNSTEKGLTSDEVNKRLLEHGKNVLNFKKKKSIFKMIFEELTASLTIILLLTAAFSFVIGEVVDACVILGIVIIDVIIGVVEENKAIDAADALSKMIITKALVLRDGKKMEINSEDLVIGDVMYLESGMKITVDGRVIESSNLLVNESSLTGESLSVEKNNATIEGKKALGDRHNMVYAGTSVMSGRATIVVTATSLETELGAIARKVEETKEEKSPLTIRMERFSKQISILILVIAVITTVILYLKGYEIKNIILSVIALSVSALPEGLALAQTMALTVASRRMARENVICKKLNSVESLGSCTVIASDKTGTLTVNEQTAKRILLPNGEEFNITGTGYDVEGTIENQFSKFYNNAERIVNLCAYNNEATFKKNVSFSGDSIDIAFLVLKEKIDSKLEIKIEKVIPYESENQYSAIFYRENGELRCTAKGSLEKIMEFSKKSKKYEEQNEYLTSDGFRVIAVCDGKVDKIGKIKNLEFLGMVGFIDPVREEAKYSIKECINAGIKVLMVTGDHPNTAFSIAQTLNICKSRDEVITGLELEEAQKLGEKYFDDLVAKKRVFSRVTPTDKLSIVESLKRQGEFVAVTGDGVNDAPAIKAANIGISMGSGTDVAKETASMIIADDDFTSIVNGIKEGRIAYSNIRKITLFLISCGLSEILFFLISIIMNLPIPLVAIQLLWLNLVTDGLQDIALSFERNSKEIMNQKPRSTKESLFDEYMLQEVIIYGLSITFAVMGLWIYLNRLGVDLTYARSAVVMLMVFIQNVHVLNCKSERNSIIKTNLFDNPLIVFTIVSSIVLEITITQVPVLAELLKVTPLKHSEILCLFVLSLVIILVSELFKGVRSRIEYIKENNM